MQSHFSDRVKVYLAQGPDLKSIKVLIPEIGLLMILIPGNFTAFRGRKLDVLCTSLEWNLHRISSASSTFTYMRRYVSAPIYFFPLYYNEFRKKYEVDM